MSKFRRSWLIILMCAWAFLSLGGCGREHIEIEVLSDIHGSSEKVSDMSEEILNEENEQHEVIYSFDNSEMSSKLIEGFFSEDYNGDGIEDSLLVEMGEQEGSFFINKLELKISCVENPYLMENEDCLFLDAFSGNFDEDADIEILLLFDMKYAGANGRLGIRLLDFDGTQYGDVCEDIFSGHQYSVTVKAGKNGGYTISSENGFALEINRANVSESALGKVTGFYSIDIISCDDTNCIRIKQYVAGEDMMDHVGDVVSEFRLEQGELMLLDERVITY
ncbi:MAG: hypothetical protein IJ327_02495 [Lachnospiraceae bacterium]|nr:hypothetical protein [Lachnospiraceae bacterium]